MIPPCSRAPAFALLVCVFPAAGLTAQERPVAADPAQSAGIHRVGWLEGCWQSAGAGSPVEERWTPPLGGSMLATSRTVRGDSLVGWEFVLLRERGEQLVYQAHPSGQATAEFTSMVAAGDSVIFENPDHDFPQRIGYRRTGDALLAWIEGTRNGTSRRIDFPYTRAQCRPAP